MNKKQIDIEVGKRIRSSRKRIGMSMKELGSRLGMHESNVSRYEKGELSLDLSQAKQIANVLGVTPEYICGWDDTQETEHYRALWINTVGREKLTDDEFIEVANYAKYIISKRKE